VCIAPGACIMKLVLCARACLQSKYLVRTFLEDGAPREVNVEASIRRELLRRYQADPQCRTLFKDIAGMRLVHQLEAAAKMALSASAVSPMYCQG
jgi:hypothetical protein